MPGSSAAAPMSQKRPLSEYPIPWSTVPLQTAARSKPVQNPGAGAGPQLPQPPSHRLQAVRPKWCLLPHLLGFPAPWWWPVPTMPGSSAAAPMSQKRPLSEYPIPWSTVPLQTAARSKPVQNPRAGAGPESPQQPSHRLQAVWPKWCLLLRLPVPREPRALVLEAIELPHMRRSRLAAKSHRPVHCSEACRRLCCQSLRRYWPNHRALRRCPHQEQGVLFAKCMLCHPLPRASCPRLKIQTAAAAAMTAPAVVPAAAAVGSAAAVEPATAPGDATAAVAMFASVAASAATAVTARHAVPIALPAEAELTEAAARGMLL